jgi:hypothetical protein
VAALGLALVFKLWMIFDATRRRVLWPWYLVLLVPLGELVYFFAVKVRDFHMRTSSPPPPPRAIRISQLEREVEGSPSFRNRVRLGWALLDAEQPERARECFERALSTHADDKEALFGLGLSQLEQSASVAAVATLSGLVERGLAYQDYDAALALAEALFRAGRKRDAFELLRAVVRDGHKLEHQLLLARYQLRGEHKDEAEATLRLALREFESQPELERRRDGAVATEARRLLRTLEQPARSTG